MRLRGKIQERIQDQVCNINPVVAEGKIGIDGFSPSMKLVVEKSGKSISYKIFDFDVKKMVGSIEIIQTHSGDYEVTGVASLPDYGATMYEIAMMSIFPSGMMSDRGGDTTDGAFGVWGKFYKRSDIQKRENPERIELNSHPNKNFLSNIIFHKEPTPEFKELESYNPSEAERTKILKKNAPFFNKMKNLRQK